MTLPKDQLQALLVRCYFDMRASRFFFFTITDPAAAGAYVRRGLSGSDWRWTMLDAWDRASAGAEGLPGQGTPIAYNVAFTYHGLAEMAGSRLDMTAALRSFPAFCRGGRAAAEDSARREFGEPAQWYDSFRPQQAARTHLVVSVFARERTLLDAWEARERDVWAAHGLVPVAGEDSAVWEQGYAMNNMLDQFLYREPISQPMPAGDDMPARYPSPQPPAPAWTMFLQDVPEALYSLKPFDDPAANAKTLALLQHGGFSAFCAFRMYAEVFHAYLVDAAHATGKSLEWVAAKMLGRFRDGTPLVLSDKPADLPPERINNFNYNPDDRCGYHCPPGSHIRRANPRGSYVAGEVDIHRIMRQSYSYGPPFDPGASAPAERGLVGHFLGASIEHQFEFLVKEWMNTGSFAGNPAEQGCPLVGSRLSRPLGPEHPEDSGQARTYSFPLSSEKSLQLDHLPQFVTIRGMSYLFFPSAEGLAWLADI